MKPKTEAQALRTRLADLERDISAEVSERVRTALEGARITSSDGRMFDGMTAAEMRAKVVAVVMGVHVVDGASSDAIEARFDHLADSTITDRVRLAMMRHRHAVN